MKYKCLRKILIIISISVFLELGLCAHELRRMPDVSKKEIKAEVSVFSQKEIAFPPAVVVEPPAPQIQHLGSYRLTSYYVGDGYGSTHCTGSGVCLNSFEVNERGWYTYKGKIVLAAATEELLRSGYNVRGGGHRQPNKHYFRYYDEVKLRVDGIVYDGIILDSCGASMWQGQTRIDLFVSNKNSAIDRGHGSSLKIEVWKEL